MSSKAFSIVSYETRFREDFRSLNQAWLEKFFVVEPFDKEVLSNPEKYLLDKGGRIYFALVDDKAVGVVGLMPGNGFIEITKMAVDPKYQGLGLGKALFEKAIEACIELGYELIHIFTNTKLKNAFYMYRRRGFIEIPFDTQQYARCNSRSEYYPFLEFTTDKWNSLLQEYRDAMLATEQLLKDLDPKKFTSATDQEPWSIVKQLKHLVAYEEATEQLLKALAINNHGNFGLDHEPSETDPGTLLDQAKHLREQNYKTLIQLDLSSKTVQNSTENQEALRWFLEAKNHNHYAQILRTYNALG